MKYETYPGRDSNPGTRGMWPTALLIYPRRHTDGPGNDQMEVQTAIKHSQVVFVLSPIITNTLFLGTTIVVHLT